MAHFFTVYKALEGKETVAGDVNGREEAVRVIKKAMEHYDECFVNPPDQEDKEVPLSDW